MLPENWALVADDALQEMTVEADQGGDGEAGKETHHKPTLHTPKRKPQAAEHSAVNWPEQ